MVEPRMTLLDALREELALTGTKKSCDRGECGACTLHVDGRRILSCMTLAAMQEGKHVTTPAIKVERLPRSPTNCMPDVSNPSRRTRCREEISHVLQHI